ncbi:hypothetical protein HPB50_011661 [Hyalomma asiaticum]|uniref:Uncharacterized protein n=1 Tax=Hyalomma asiaticum TaxID=266040 RepID=A0ACB7RKB3_HYAAI|nr:hypothetical protein HPB50_011661 [Hyalomma asiaticum]
MADESSHRNTPSSSKNFDDECNTGREGSGSDDDSDPPLDFACSHRHERPRQHGASLLSSESDVAPRPCSEDYGSNSSAPLDLAGKTQEATLAKEENKIQYPVADASSHVPSKGGKTLEHSHFSERRKRLHSHEQAQREERGSSSESMKGMLRRTLDLILEQIAFLISTPYQMTLQSK